MIENSLSMIDKKLLKASVGTIYQQDPFCVEPTTPISEVLNVMRMNSIGSVLITDANKKLLGIFTERDYLQKLVPCSDCVDVPVSELMTANPYAQKVTDSVAYALNMMSKGGFRHIPLVDDDYTVVGVLSIKDIIDAIMADIDKTIDEKVLLLTQ